MKSQVREWRNAANTEHGRMLYLWCPGCDSLHGVELDHPPTTWQWDGNLEAPTLSPSILTYSGGRDGSRNCHAYVRQGRWEFLADSYHALAGQTVDLPERPDWFVND